MHWGIPMTEHDIDSRELDLLFATARAHRPDPSAALLSRIAADAEALQRRPQGAVRPARPGLFGQMRAALGGWPALGSLATATVAGVWVGISPPEDLSLAAETMLGLDEVSYLVDTSADVVLGLDEGAL